MVLPEPIGGNDATPYELTSKQVELCYRVDALSEQVGYKSKPSEMFLGALFTSQEIQRQNNPDWIAQACHSLREILYPIYSKNAKAISVKRGDALKKFGAVRHNDQKMLKRMAVLYSRLSTLAHHGSVARDDKYKNFTAGDFELLLAEFEDVMFSALARQVNVHEEIDVILGLGPPNPLRLEENIPDLVSSSIIRNGYDKKTIEELIGLNFDAREYFLSKADEKWFEWLWKNDFLDVVRERAADPSRMSYRTPELNYLTRVVEKASNLVVDFILDVVITDEIFNPEVVDRFLWICSKLPADQLARVVSKIRNENWIRLMGGFGEWGFEYKDMLNTLSSAKDYANLIILAEAVLSVRSVQELEKEHGRSMFGNPFYLQGLQFTEVFDRLAEIDDSALEEASSLIFKVFKQVAELGSQKEDGVFDRGELFPLFDVDFFQLTLEEERHASSRDDIKDLAALGKVFVVRKMHAVHCDPTEVRRYHEVYLATLPNTRTIWRFKLFVWAQCPEVFKEELKKGFFRIFDYENPFLIAGGPEYEHALRAGFKVLSEADRRGFIDGIFEKLNKEQRKMYGYGILSSIFAFLSEEDKKKAEEIFNKPLNEHYAPEPSIPRVRGGTVVHQAPSKIEELLNGSILAIVESLKTDHSPEVIHQTYPEAEQDFLYPIDAEGVGNSLKEKIKQRLREFVHESELFFDREKLNPHYTYTFLQGVRDAIKEDPKKIKALDLTPFFAMGKKIVNSGRVVPFDKDLSDRERFDAWLASWRGVHLNLADVMQELLQDQEEAAIVDFITHRDVIFSIISYLLSFPDPEPKDEVIETATMKTRSGGEHEDQVSDPLTVAINSVRGRAFQAFLEFVYQDGKQFSKEEKHKISEDVRNEYESVLTREDTQSIMFMFGHYVPFFFYRDQEWVESLLPKIFINDPLKKHLYLGAWEGYLSASLYREVFQKLQGEYARGIALDPSSYVKRSHRVDLDEALATHLALAYMYFEDFTIDSDLYRSFWETGNTKRQGAFVSFIGRHAIMRTLQAKDSSIDFKKLEVFWDWAFTNCKDSEVFREFGSWMKVERGIFDPIWLAEHVEKTLEMSGGDIEWEIGFIDSLPALAKVAPEKMLSILRRYLVDGPLLKKPGSYIRVDKNLTEVIQSLYDNPSTKSDTYNLINDLLPLGNGRFWSLMDIVK